MPIPTDAMQYNRKSAKEIVLEAVQDWIVSGVLKPGEKIVDTELAKYFNVSRTPVREALQTLAGIGFVEVVPSCGTQVAGIDAEDVRQCYEMLAEMQATAVRLASGKIGKQEIDELRELNRRFEQAAAARDVPKQREADEAFHSYITAKAGNEYLDTYTAQLQIRSMRVENLFFEADEGQQVSVEQHRRIIDSMEKGDISSAEEAMRANWMCTFDHLEDLIRTQSPEQ